jgi:hypothetical protein
VVLPWGEEWRDLWVLRVSVNEAIRHLPRRVRPVTPVVGVDLAEMVATREMIVLGDVSARSL